MNMNFNLKIKNKMNGSNYSAVAKGRGQGGVPS